MKWLLVILSLAMAYYIDVGANHDINETLATITTPIYSLPVVSLNIVISFLLKIGFFYTVIRAFSKDA
jgi:hypothetical protein